MLLPLRAGALLLLLLLLMLLLLLLLLIYGFSAIHVAALHVAQLHFIGPEQFFLSKPQI
jgi:hypothetical protein